MGIEAKRPAEINRITDMVIGAAIAVHRELGPGLLESTYQSCLTYELAERNLRFLAQKTIPVMYKGIRMDCGYRADFVVENAVLLELKAIERFEPIHTAQMITYLRLSGLTVGLLINFNVELLKFGIRRFVNGLPADTAEEAENRISPQSSQSSQSYLGGAPGAGGARVQRQVAGTTDAERIDPDPPTG